MYGDYLSHYGILGQKWGQRNYQNEDGSLTAAGRERYGVGPARESGSSSSGAAVVVRKKPTSDTEESATANSNTKQTKDAKKEAKALKTKEDVIKSGDYNTIMRYKSKLSDDELKRALNRLATEAELAKYAPKTPQDKKKLASTGKTIVSDIYNEVGKGALQGVGKAATTVSAMVAVYYGEKLVEKLLNGKMDGDQTVASKIFNDKIKSQAYTNVGQKKK